MERMEPREESPPHEKLLQHILKYDLNVEHRENYDE
jgi:hypothetical protein